MRGWLGAAGHTPHPGQPTRARAPAIQRLEQPDAGSGGEGASGRGGGFRGEVGGTRLQSPEIDDAGGLVPQVLKERLEARRLDETGGFGSERPGTDDVRRASLLPQTLGQTRSHPGLVVEDAPVPRERAGLSRPRDLAPGQPVEDGGQEGVASRRRHDLLGDPADRDAAEESHRAAVLAVGVDVAGHSLVIAPVTGHEHRMDPARSHPGGEEVEGVHRDRHVRPGPARRLAVEVSVLGNEGGVDVQAGVEESGMEPVTLRG